MPMPAEDGIIVLSTGRAADDLRLSKGGPAGDAAKQNGAVDHFTAPETELIRLRTSQQEAVALSAGSPPSSAAADASVVAANGVMSTSGMRLPGAQQLRVVEPSLQPQLVQRLERLREALDGPSVQGPQRSAALRAFATLCLACSPQSTQAASQVRTGSRLIIFNRSTWQPARCKLHTDYETPR